jgi:sec-independent protein translocase protein TatC
VFSALLTPPDVVSQLLMAGPVMVLYLGSVLVAMVVTRRRERDDDDPEGH